MTVTPPVDPRDRDLTVPPPLAVAASLVAVEAFLLLVLAVLELANLRSQQAAGQDQRRWECTCGPDRASCCRTSIWRGSPARVRDGRSGSDRGKVYIH